ncbi:MAG: hypothetical protein DRI56_04820 [Chloroflexota bacterium]|nr:MAG: hypothetical protein DRI56_04820 [Chloroflexota bacterium]
MQKHHPSSSPQHYFLESYFVYNFYRRINLLHANSITTILFDLDGTLVHHLPSSLDVFLQILAEKGIEQAEDAQTWPRVRRWIHYYWAQSPELVADIDTFGENGDLTEVFWENYLRKKFSVAGISEEEVDELLPQVAPLMEERYAPQSSVPADVPPTLSALRKERFTLGLVSNRSNPFQEEIEGLGLAEFFDFAITAGEVGSWKPDEKIFLHALKLAQSAPENALYVGDNYYADIIGAQEAGLHSILVDPRGVFPNAECPVIDSVGELAGQLGVNI